MIDANVFIGESLYENSLSPEDLLEMMEVEWTVRLCAL
jgi:hypothetical protein